MRVVVNFDFCRRTGRCCITAPEVFSFNEEGLLTFMPHPDEASRARLEDAVDNCPTQSITIKD